MNRERRLLSKRIDDEIKNEICTEMLMLRVAEYGEFMEKNPNHPMIEEVKRMWSVLCTAHRKSRIYVDEEHKKEWRKIMWEADSILLKAVLS